MVAAWLPCVNGATACAKAKKLAAPAAQSQRGLAFRGRRGR